MNLKSMSRKPSRGKETNARGFVRLDTPASENTRPNYAARLPELDAVTVHRSAIRAFLEVPFTGDPQYQTIEVQLLETSRGVGCVVHLLDHERRLDVYADPVLGLDETWFQQDASTSHMTRGELVTWSDGDLDGRVVAELSWDDASVEADVHFRDRHGRLISVRVAAPRPPRWRWGHIFTPAPAGIQEPKLLRLLLMREFWLLPRTSAVTVFIEGEARTPTRFPIPIGGRGRLYARFASGISLLAINHEFAHTPPSIEQLECVRAEDSRAEVTSIATRTGADRLAISFSPPLATRARSGQIEFRLGDQRVGNGLYSHEPSGETGVLTWTNVDQNWNPSRPWPSSTMIELARRYKRRAVRYRWSSEPPSHWRLGATAHD